MDAHSFSPSRSRGQRLAYSSIHFGYSLLSVVVSVLLMYFYTDIMLLPAASVTLILMTARLFDGIVDPFLGYYMDGRTTKYGKYRGYILYWAAPLALLFALMFQPAPVPGVLAIFWCLAIYLMWTFSFSMVEVASLPMLALVGLPKDRTATNTAKITAAILASLAATSLTLQMVSFLGQGSESRGFSVTAILLSGIVFLTVLAGAAFVREQPSAVRLASQISFRSSLILILKNRSIVFVFCMYICLELASSLKLQAAVYYLKYNIARPELTSVFLTVAIVSSLLMQPLIVPLSRRFSRRFLMISGIFGAIAGMLVIGAAGSSILLLMLGNVLCGLTSAFPANLVYVYTIELSEALSRQHQSSFGGLINSLLGFAAKVGMTCASVLITLTLHFTGYVPNIPQSSSTITGIQVCFVTLTLIALALAAVFLTASYARLRQSFPMEFMPDADAI